MSRSGDHQYETYTEKHTGHRMHRTGRIRSWIIGGDTRAYRAVVKVWVYVSRTPRHYCGGLIEPGGRLKRLRICSKPNSPTVLPVHGLSSVQRPDGASDNLSILAMFPFRFPATRIAETEGSA